jgi:hypothetical protein
MANTGFFGCINQIPVPQAVDGFGAVGSFAKGRMCRRDHEVNTVTGNLQGVAIRKIPGAQLNPQGCHLFRTLWISDQPTYRETLGEQELDYLSTELPGGADYQDPASAGLRFRHPASLHPFNDQLPRRRHPT